LHAYPDLFCEFYDALDPVQTRERAEEWLSDDALNSLAESVRADVAHGRSAAAVRMRVMNPPAGPGSGEDTQSIIEGRRFAALVGLDRAFAHVAAVKTTLERTPVSLVLLAAHVEVHGRLDSGDHGGALLPRLVQRGRYEGSVSDRRELFTSVIRVPAVSWERCEVVRLGEAVTLHRHEVAAGILIGCVPVIADPAEIVFRVRGRPGGNRYRVGPAGLPVTDARITQIVDGLDRAGVLIGVAPELTLTPSLLRGWQQALRRGDRGPTSLRMVLAGTGVLHGGEGRAPNTAILLDGRTGEVIARQGKFYGFDFTPEEIVRWRLESQLGAGPVAEDLLPASKLTVLDGGGLRIAILICEDLARLLDLAPLVRDLGISHVLTPVFARPIREHRWEEVASRAHARETGTTIVVSNSLVMQSIAPRDGGSSLVLAPHKSEALIGRSSDPAGPACFMLTPDGSAELL
jgi:predicted amidohydrolase